MSDRSANALPAFSSAIADLVRRVGASVVSIHADRYRSSGFVWRSGLVVAAESGVPDDGEISVVAHDGTSSRATLAGRDPSTDVAVLRVQRTDLPPASLSAERPPTGAAALVLGARDGAPVASLGVVSFSGSQWRSMRGGLIDWRLELDAELRRASEGGLALDAEGRAFGMAVFGPRRLTLVIPSPTIERVAEVLAAKGKIERGYLGLALQPVKLEGGAIGAMAMTVAAQGPGAVAGIRQGDVIVAWNGEPIRGIHYLLRALGPDSVGTSVKLSIRRGGEPMEVTLVVGERPDPK